MIKHFREVALMPLYEYRCKKCKHHFEKLKPMSKMDELEKMPQLLQRKYGTQIISFWCREKHWLCFVKYGILWWLTTLNLLAEG